MGQPEACTGKYQRSCRVAGTASGDPSLSDKVLHSSPDATTPDLDAELIRALFIQNLLDNFSGA